MLALPADLTRPEAVTEVFARTEREFGPLDVLFANAGGLLQRSRCGRHHPGAVEPGDRGQPDQHLPVLPGGAALDGAAPQPAPSSPWGVAGGLRRRRPRRLALRRHQGRGRHPHPQPGQGGRAAGHPGERRRSGPDRHPLPRRLQHAAGPRRRGRAHAAAPRGHAGGRGRGGALPGLRPRLLPRRRDHPDQRRHRVSETKGQGGTLIA